MIGYVSNRRLQKLPMLNSCGLSTQGARFCPPESEILSLTYSFSLCYGDGNCCAAVQNLHCVGLCKATPSQSFQAWTACASSYSCGSSLAILESEFILSRIFVLDMSCTMGSHYKPEPNSFVLICCGCSAAQVHPKGDLVLAKVASAEEKTTGGVLLPDSAQTKPTSGTC